MKQCPRCRFMLTELTIEGITVDGCSWCGGVWLDAGELKQVAQRGESTLRDLEEAFPQLVSQPVPQAPQDAPLCPNCDIPLREFEFPQAPGIKLDACPRCRGIWLDEGEALALHRRIMARRATTRMGAPQPMQREHPSKARQPVDVQPMPIPAIEIEGAPPTPPKPSIPQAPTHSQMALKQRAGALTTAMKRIKCPKCGRENFATDLQCWACATVLKEQPLATKAIVQKHASETQRTSWQTAMLFASCALATLILIGAFIHIFARQFIPPWMPWFGPRIPKPVGWVNDFANIIDAPTEATLTEISKRLEQQTGIEYAVATVKSLNGYSIERYAYRMFNKWRIGKRHKNNGVLLLVALNDRKLRIHVGRGMEHVLTNNTCSRIIRTVMIPLLRQKQYSAACYWGSYRIVERVAETEGLQLAALIPSRTEAFAYGMPMPEYSASHYGASRGRGYSYRRLYRRGGPISAFFLILMMIGWVVMLILRWHYAVWGGWGWHVSGWGGAGWGGDGFGGFGGGSAGGGGASGSW